jgi:hypothetical protein
VFDPATQTLAPITRMIKVPTPPAPDTPEGRVLIASLLVGTFFLLLLVSVNTALADQAAVWVPLVLILGTILSLTLGSRLMADRANVRIVELELARTVSVHNTAGQLPDPDSPLGGVLREYVHTADDLRRHWRTDAYAAGPAMWGALLALFSAVLWGLSFSTGTVWVAYVAIVVELPTLMILIFSVTVLAMGIGQARPVDGFAALTPRRWTGFQEYTPALETAIAGLPWLADYARELRDDKRASNPGASSTTWAEPSA